VSTEEPKSTDEPKRKLSYLHQREWDAMEAKILDAEHDLAACQGELEAFASDANRVAEVYEKMQAAQRRVDELYARWAELEGLVAK
jgi:ATP-binding cassette subfamily F protein uup